MGSEIRKPNHFKFGQTGAILSKIIWNLDKIIWFSNGLDYSYSHSPKVETFKKSGFQIFLDLESLDFRYPLYLFNRHYFDNIFVVHFKLSSVKLLDNLY